MGWPGGASLRLGTVMLKRTRRAQNRSKFLRAGSILLGRAHQGGVAAGHAQGAGAWDVDHLEMLYEKWRRGESNPRPKLFRACVYVRSS